MAQFFVTVDHTKVSADLTDYPIYINLANAPASFWSVVKNGGGDIRVYKADGITQLAREVVSCDTGTDTGELHVKFTGTLSASVDTKIIIDVDGRRPDYAVTATFGRNAVWSGYRAVYHLSNTNDSTGNGYNLTRYGTDNITYSAGKVGNAAHSAALDTTLGYRGLIVSVAEFTGNWKYSGWFRSTSTTSVWHSIFMWRAGSPFYQLWNNVSSGTNAMNFNSATEYPIISYNSYANNTTYRFDMVLNSGNTTELYINGASVATSSTSRTGSSVTYHDQFALFSSDTYSVASGLIGFHDEFRITVGNTHSSDEWVATEYNNQNDPATFSSWSEQVPKRFALTIDNTKVAADLVDFPVYVDLSIMPARFWATVSNGGGDIRVYKQGKSAELPREVVSCDTTLKTGELHFKYNGTLSSSTPTVVIIEVDGVKTDYAVTASFGRNAVWSNERLVAHLQSSGIDSTGNHTATDSALSFTSQKLGVGADFEASSNAQVAYGSVVTGVTSHLRMSAWLAPENPSKDGMVFGKTNVVAPATDSYYMYFVRSTDSTGYFNVFVGNGTTNVYWDTPTFNISPRAKYDITYNTTDQVFRFYTNGSLTSTSGVLSVTSINNTASNFYLGRWHLAGSPSNQYHFDGEIDEARIVGNNAARISTNWILTEYNNQNANATFFSSIAETGQSGWLNIATGTYTGTGGTSGTRSITGIGFKPKFVLVWSDDTAEIYPAFSYESALAGLGNNIAFLGENGWGTATVSDRFQSFDANGFTFSIGSSATAGNKPLNKNAATFYYLAIGGPDIVTGSFTGNGVDNRNITGVGFLASLILSMGGTQHSVMRFLSTGATTDLTSYTYNAADVADQIQTITDDGFQVGTAVQSNANAVVQYWMAIKSGPKFFQSQFVGNATDNRAITEPGFQPNFVYLKANGIRNFGLRSSNHSGDLSKFYRSSGFAANYIQSLDATGFTIGNAADINTNAETVRYFALQNEITHEVAINETITITESTSPDISNQIRRENSTYVSAASAASHSFSFNVSSRPNRLLVVWSIDRLSNAASQISSITYAGNALTFSQEFESAKANFGHATELWYQFNPTPGNNTLQINYSPNQGTEIWVLEYSAVKQSDFALTNSGYQFNSGTTVSANVTATKQGQWVLSPAILNRAFSSGSNFVRPQTPVSNLQYGDTNGPVSPGVITVSVTQSTTPSIGLFSFLLEPFDTAEPALTVSVSDALTITESVTAVRTVIFSASVSDTLTITESTTQLRTTFASVSDLITVTENVNPNRIYFLSAFDAITISEFTARQQALVTSVFDTVSITETTTQLRSVFVSTSDTLTITENVTRLTSLFATATENVAIAESVTTQKVNLVNLFDLITISESTVSATALVRSVFDSISISEQVTLERPVTSVQLPQDRYKGTAKRINMKVGGSI